VAETQKSLVFRQAISSRDWLRFVGQGRDERKVGEWRPVSGLG
jgi:hypothetical protein